MLSRLHPKWHPATRPPPDGLTLTKRRKQANEAAQLSQKFILFDPSITLRGDLTEGFRIFTDPTRTSHIPAHRISLNRGLPLEATTVWTDGSCMDNGTPDARAGSGLWYGPNDSRNLSARVPGATQSNQTGEIFAIILAVARAPPYSPLYIVSDSQYCIDGLTNHLPNWEAAGWHGVCNSDFFKAAAYHLRIRGAPTYFSWIKGHSGDPGNEGADRLAAAATCLPLEPSPLLIVPQHFEVSGAKLAGISQSLAYRAIRELTPIPERRNTSDTVSLTLYGVQLITHTTHTPSELWLSTRLPVFSRKISDFLWKSLHNLHKCGPYWKHFLPERILCSTCNIPESLDHILTRCSAPGQALIWTLTAQLWSYTNLPWLQPSLASILGCGLIPCPALPDHPPSKHRTRLLRILISEAAHLIWRLRCERVVGNALNPAFHHSNLTITNLLRAALTRRLNMDCAIARRTSTLRRAPHIHVQAVWGDLIQDEDNLPFSWYFKGDFKLALRI